jgi:hypothetical protein
VVHDVTHTKQSCVGTLCANRKNVPPVVKNNKLKKGEHCGQHSGGVTALAWQDKKVSMIYTYHKDEMHATINKVNQEETKAVVVCNYSVDMLEVDLKDQMLQPDLLE